MAGDTERQFIPHNLNLIVESNHRLVHLDLKGAPPKLSYLTMLLPLLREQGATGILVEYEDTFPYKGYLQHLRRQPDTPLCSAGQGPPIAGAAVALAGVAGSTTSTCETLDSNVRIKNFLEENVSITSPGDDAAASGTAVDAPVTTTTTAITAAAPIADAGGCDSIGAVASEPELHYTEKEVQELLSCAADCGLKIIPLVQTFGHVEFILKHRRHRHLRESMQHPNALCPRHPDSLLLVQQMVQQVVEAHPAISHLHLGMDEVLVGACERCKVSSRERVYLEWAVLVCGWLRRTYTHLTPIIWDDMLRTMPLQDLKASGIGQLTDVMIWKYDGAALLFPEGYLGRIAQVFTNYDPDRTSGTGGGVWAASAYKGATGSTQCLVPAQHHIDNHIAWLNVIRQQPHCFVCFRGFALTGWQRYDHMSLLCELLPAAVPSVVLCLQVLAATEFTELQHLAVSRRLGFKQLVSLVHRPPLVEEGLQFPGHQLYTALQCWVNIRAMYSQYRASDIVAGWYHQYRRRQQFVSPGVLDTVRPQLHCLFANVQECYERLQHELLQVFDRHTAHEWLSCYVLPLRDKITREWLELVALDKVADGTATCSFGTCSCNNAR